MNELVLKRLLKSEDYTIMHLKKVKNRLQQQLEYNLKLSDDPNRPIPPNEVATWRSLPTVLSLIFTISKEL